MRKLSVLLVAMAVLCSASVSFADEFDLRINEILPDPANNSDWSGNGSYSPVEDEFIEIFNGGTTSVDLTGLWLGDDGGQQRWEIPGGTIDPGCFYVFYGEQVNTFSLNNTGDTVYLTTANGTIIDQYSYTTANDDEAHRRIPDGSGSWSTSQSCSPGSAGTQCPSPWFSNDGTVVCASGSPTPATTATPTPGTPTATPTINPNAAVFINEILPDPDDDWDGNGTFDALDDEFIELYNPTGQPLDLSGWYLGDDGGQQRYQITSLIIDPNCFAVIYGSDIGTFSLNNAGDTVYLSDPSGNVVDSYNYATSNNNESHRRIPDGGTWGLSDPCGPAQAGTGNCPNPGLSNDGAITCGSSTPRPTATPGTPTATPTINPNLTLVINEIMPDPDSDWDGDGSFSPFDDEFIEIFNATGNVVNLDGYYLGDDGGQQRYQIQGVSVDPFCFVVFYGSDIGNFSLNNGGDTVYLSDPQGNVVDSYQYATSANDTGYHRLPDGGAWSQTDPCSAGQSGANCPSPGLSNDGSIICGSVTPQPTATPGTPTATPTRNPNLTVVINEILPDPDDDWDGNGQFNALDDEFIELFNASGSTVDLSGWFLGDDGGQQRYQIQGLTIAPNCALVIYGSDIGTFSLNNSGDTVYLSDASGNVVDSYNYASSANNVAHRRIPDAGAWGLSDPCGPGQAGSGNCPSPGLSNDGTFPPCGPAVTATPTPSTPTATPTINPNYPVVINEILPDPNSDWDGDGNFNGLDDEFIEIYNTSSNPVDLRGFWLGDDGGQKRFQIDNYIIPGDCFIVIYASEIGTFSLNNGGDTIYLTAPDDTIVDQFTYTASNNDVSYRRMPDGGAWTTSQPCDAASPGPDCPSPGVSNDGTIPCTPPPTLTPSPTPTLNPQYPVRINEVLPDPNSDWNGDGQFSPFEDEFIELYNLSPNPINLGGLWIGDSGGRKRFRVGSITVPGNCFYIFDGVQIGTFSMDNGGDTIYLTADNNIVIDSFTYNGSFNDRSWQRIPDGTGTWEQSPSCAAPGGGPSCPNPGASNDGQVPCVQTTPTATPTASPTPIRTLPPTATPTATPQVANAGMELFASFPNRVITVEGRIFNFSPQTIPVLAYVLVEIDGIFYFYPTFGEEALPAADFDLAGNLDTGRFLLWELPLPTPLGVDLPLYWWGGLVNKQTGTIIGDLAFDEVTVN